MKAAFFFDTVLLKDENSDFWGMTLTYDFFKERYLSMFDEMIVSTRVNKKENEDTNISGYRKSNGNNVEIKPINSYQNIPDALRRKNSIRKEVENIVDEVDKVVVRMPSVIGMFACEYSKKINKPYIIEMVACPWDGYSNHTNKMGKIIAPIMWHLTKKYVKKAKKVLYVTDEFLQRRYPTKGEQIACSDVVLQDFDDSILDKRIEKINQRKDSDKVKLSTVASVGLKYKGQEYVIRALKELNKKKTKYEYYLAGGGESNRLKNIAKECGVEEDVHFLGSIPHNEVFKLIDDTDIYIQPSLQEGLPRAMIEAMSRACPAIGARTGGIPELIEDKFVFKRKSVKGLINAIKNIEADEVMTAKRNYNECKRFEKNELEKKRKKFYTE